jgi:hypothetical protein
MNVTAQVCSALFASGCMRSCNCGEALSASVQRKATETKAAMKLPDCAFMRLSLARELLSARSARQENFCTIDVRVRVVAAVVPTAEPKRMHGSSVVAALPAANDFQKRTTRQRYRNLNRQVKNRTRPFRRIHGADRIAARQHRCRFRRATRKSCRANSRHRSARPRKFFR